MMKSVAGGIQVTEGQPVDFKFAVTAQNGEFLIGDGKKFSPKRIHHLAVNAGSTDDQPFWGEQVRCTHFMNINLCTLPSQLQRDRPADAARCAGDNRFLVQNTRSVQG